MLPQVAFSIRGLISQSAASTLCNGVTHATDYPVLCPHPNLPPHAGEGTLRQVSSVRMLSCFTRNRSRIWSSKRGDDMTSSGGAYTE